MTAKVNFTEARDDEWPLCPSCQKELREIRFKKRGWLTTLMVFWCPHCRSLLSTSTTFNG
jgi:formamidopyrimidine-DNA glycosylase